MCQIKKENCLKNMFLNGQNLFKQGKVIESKYIFQQILTQESKKICPNLHYECLLNLSTICLQTNQVQSARKLLITAISINQQRYQAFYNLAVANYYLKNNYSQSISSLQICLSLLYFQLGNLSDSLKLLNKSISLNPTNHKAYLSRAHIYEKNRKIKLAQNQYDKLTFQNDLHDFNSSILTEIYLQKCLFYRRIKNVQKLQENLKIYNQLKKKTPLNIQNQINPKIQHLFQSENQNQQNQIQSLQIIKKFIKQAQGLIKQISQPIYNKSKEIQGQNNIGINKHQQQNKDLNKKAQSHWEEKTPKVQQDSQLLQPDYIGQQNPKKPSIISQENQNQQNPSISYNQDEDSAILNLKIQQLQRQIKESGGNVPQIKDIQRNSQQENFLEFQIQKTIEEISKKRQQQKYKKGEKNMQSSTQRSSFSGDAKSMISNSESKRRKSSFHDDAMTLRSKISQSYEINLQEMRSYNSFQLQIRSVSMFDEKCSKREAYIKIKYLQKQLLTEKCKNQKFTWNHNFDQEILNHPSESQEDESIYHLLIELHAQQGGWLSWHRDVLLGTGTIKLTQKGTTKCTLQLNDEKVGMLYYKIKLKKNTIQEEK